MKKYDVVTLLDLCVDFLVDLGETIPEFGQKEKRVNDYLVELGGSATIFSTQAAKLGLKIAGVGGVGNDILGKIVLEKLQQCGIQCEFIKTVEVKTGVGIVLCKPDDRAILTCTGSIDSLQVDDFPFYILGETRHLHIASFFLLQKMQRHFEKIIQDAKKLGVTVSLDCNWDPDEQWNSGMKDLFSLIDLFMPNEKEAMAISGTNNLEEAQEWLSERIPLVIIKKGAKGSVAIHNKRVYNARPPYNGVIVDSVGAGDSFDAGFIYGYLQQMDIGMCLRLGNFCGSRTLGYAGGIEGQPSSIEIKNFLDNENTEGLVSIAG